MQFDLQFILVFKVKCRFLKSCSKHQEGCPESLSLPSGLVSEVRKCANARSAEHWIEGVNNDGECEER